jgi:hypothetical protein
MLKQAEFLVFVNSSCSQRFNLVLNFYILLWLYFLSFANSNRIKRVV